MEVTRIEDVPKGMIGFSEFVFRYLKKDSFTGRMRSLAEPNVPLQDGNKLELLCGECEGRFSVNETHFANKIYHPFKKDGFKGLPYDGNWLHYFITSVSWRHLVLDIPGFDGVQDKENSITEKQLVNLKKVEEIMRSYLLGKSRDIDSIENHIFFFDTVKSASGEMASLGPYSTMQGSAFGYTVIASGAIYVFANLTGVLVVSVIKKHPVERWGNTYVKLTEGKIKVPQRSNSPVFSELIHVAKQRAAFWDSLSEIQRQQIIDKIEKDPEGFKESGSFKRRQVDLNMEK